MGLQEVIKTGRDTYRKKLDQIRMHEVQNGLGTISYQQNNGGRSPESGHREWVSELMLHSNCTNKLQFLSSELEI